MRHQPLADIRALIASAEPAAMSRRERLRRWQELLRREPDRAYATLQRVEFYSETEQDRLRANGSPLALAYADPVLRAAGLGGDTIGHARRFFGLSSDDMHYLVCDCHFRGRMTGASVGSRLGDVSSANPLRRLWARMTN
jgi:hypothetical protein